MFETPREIEQREPKGLWIVTIVAVLVVMVGAFFYTKYRGSAQKPAAAAGRTSAGEGRS
jgi:ABC-type polysaccharide/polyol phosphate export permease